MLMMETRRNQNRHLWTKEAYLLWKMRTFGLKQLVVASFDYAWW
jgi:hypothetical protein